MANVRRSHFGDGFRFHQRLRATLAGPLPRSARFFSSTVCTACVVDVLDDPRSLHRMVQGGRSRVIGHARASIYSAATLIG